MRTKRRSRLLSVLLCLCMLFSIIPLPGTTYAAEMLCPNHQEHTQECGYVEAVEGAPCNHLEAGEHKVNGGGADREGPLGDDENCGCTEGTPEVACDKNCTDTDGDGQIDHQEGCAYTPAVPGSPCKHREQGAHDAACGYIEAVEGAPCTHACDQYTDGSSGGSPAPAQDAVCDCTVLCTEGAMDIDCPVCGSEGALPEGCGFIACTKTEGCTLPAGHGGECAAAAVMATSLLNQVYSLDIAEGDITVSLDIADDIVVKQGKNVHTLKDGEELSLYGTADNRFITFRNVGTESSPLKVELDNLHMTQDYQEESTDKNRDAIALVNSHVNFYLKGESTIQMSQIRATSYCQIFVSWTSSAAFDDSEQRGEYQVGTGKLTLTKNGAIGTFSSCIGGRNYCTEGYGTIEDNTGKAGTMVFNGGTIVTRPGGSHAAAIGVGCSTRNPDGYEPQFKRIEVNGGHLDLEQSGSGSCIGAGSPAAFADGTNNIIQINGGAVDATGTGSGTAIGAPYNGSISRIEINGGAVNAVGGDSGNTAGAGISCGCYTDGEILITGGIVNATGGSLVDPYEDNKGGSGAGIGGMGSFVDRSVTPVHIQITGGTVTAKGGDAPSEGGGAGAGIGTGGSYQTAYASQGLKNTIEITGGTVKAIGGAGYGQGVGNRVKRGAPGIGTGGNFENNTCQTDITISGGNVYAIGGTGGVGSGTDKNGNFNNDNIKCKIKAYRDSMIPSNDNFLPNIYLFPSLPGGNGSAAFFFAKPDGSFVTGLTPVMLHTEPGAYVRAGVRGEMGMPLLQVRSSSQQADRGIPAVNAGDVTAWFPENQQDDAQFDVIDPGSRNRAAQGSKVKIMNAKETWVNRLEVPLSPLFADEILLNLSEDAPNQPALAGDPADQPFGRIDSFALEGVDDLAEIDTYSGVVKMKQGASVREGQATLTAKYAGDMREPLRLYATVAVKIVSDTSCTITCETPTGRFEEEVSVTLQYGLAEELTVPEETFVKKYVWSLSQTPPAGEREFTEAYDGAPATQTAAPDEPYPQEWYLHAYAQHPLVNGGTPTIETFGPYTLTGAKPAITTPETLPEGQLEEAYKQTLEADSVTPLTWCLAQGSALPPGLSLNGDTGEISGVPTRHGDYAFTVEAANTAGTVSGTFHLHIERIVAQGLTVSPPTLTLEKGEERQLTVTFLPENTTNQEVTYATSDDAVAIVTQEGSIKAIGAGQVTIIVTAQDGGYEGTCIVTVPAPEHPVLGQPPQGPLDLAKDAVFTFQGEYQNLETIRLNGHTLTLISTDSSHAELSGYPGSEGKLGEVKSGSVIVTLHKEFLQTLSGGEYQLEVVFLDGRVPGTGSTTFEIATVITGLPENETLTIGQNVSWTPAPVGGVWSYDKDYLEITQNGGSYTFKALKAGKAIATYTVDGVSYTVKLTINKTGEAPGTAPEEPTSMPETSASQSESSAPQTGDTSNTLPFILLALASLLGCIGLISYKNLCRKRRQG